MKKRFICGLLAAVLCAGLFAGCGRESLRLGAAREGGAYWQLAQAYSALPGSPKVEPRATAGSAANLRLLTGGYIPLAIAQSDLARNACEGTGIFENQEVMQSFSAVAALYDEPCQLIVRADSGIATPEDLQGKIVCTGEEESGTEQNAWQILSAYGLNTMLLHTVSLDYTEAAAALRSGEIDAMFCTAAVGVDVLAELAADCGIRLLPIDGAAANRLLQSYPDYYTCTIPAGSYAGQTEDVTTVAVQALLLASDSLPADTVRTLTERLFKAQDALQATVPAALDFSAPDSTVPLHAGAAAYFAAGEGQ